MSTAKTLAAVRRSKQFQNLLSAGLKLVSTDRQLQNGTLSFTGKVKRGRTTLRPSFSVTSTGAVISNKFTARRIESDSPTDTYKQGLSAVAELLEKRLA